MTEERCNSWSQKQFKTRTALYQSHKSVSIRVMGASHEDISAVGNKCIPIRITE